jgi:hypothetical protein
VFGARYLPFGCHGFALPTAAIAQLGERQTEDLKVPGSIPGLGSFGVACLRCVVLFAVVSGVVAFVVARFVSGTMGFSCFENLACQAEFQFVCAWCLVGVGLLLLLWHCNSVGGLCWEVHVTWSP